MSEIFKYNSTAMYYFQMLGKQAGSTVSMTHAGSSGSGRQILGLGLESRIPAAPIGQEGMQALEGLARLESVQTPLR